LSFADPQTMPRPRDAFAVKRDGDGILHFPEGGRPMCGYAGPVMDLIHPVDRAALWCSACFAVVRERTART
jgi:hypothetical protein